VREWCRAGRARATEWLERRGGAELWNIPAGEVARVKDEGLLPPGPGAPRPPDRSLSNAAGAPRARARGAEADRIKWLLNQRVPVLQLGGEGAPRSAVGGDRWYGEIPVRGAGAVRPVRGGVGRGALARSGPTASMPPWRSRRAVRGSSPSASRS
jgi:hypothetical protein